MIDVVFGFEHTYEVCLLDSAPAGPQEIPVLYFPGVSSEGGKDGLMVKVTPKVGPPPWIGVFAFGFPNFLARSGVYSCPDPFVICVVSKGQAYLVPTHDPTVCTAVPSIPVCEIMPLSQYGLLLFADNTTVTAVGKQDVAWKTERLVADDLKILAADETNGLLTVSGWDPINSERRQLKLDLATGQIAS